MRHPSFPADHLVMAAGVGGTDAYAATPPDCELDWHGPVSGGKHE
jgi:hypothetical protein